MGIMLLGGPPSPLLGRGLARPHVREPSGGDRGRHFKATRAQGFLLRVGVEPRTECGFPHVLVAMYFVNARSSYSLYSSPRAPTNTRRLGGNDGRCFCSPKPLAELTQHAVQ